MSPQIDLVLALLLVFFDVLAFIFFGIDKLKSKKLSRRISENDLLLLAFLGGSGAALGMQVFHHKTRHRKFSVLVPVFAVVRTAIYIFIIL